MKLSKTLYIAMVVFSLLCLLIVYIPIQGTQADETYYNVDISTDPSSGFLIVDNMAPGDEKTSVLMVSNNGNLDFNYTVSTRQEAGDSTLYNMLLLRISDSEGLLYEGIFSDLADFSLGTIAQSASETLNFTAELPIETGNEIQGQTVSVAFDFTAYGHEEQIPISDCFEPPFSNNNFTLHQKSTVPIMFHLRNENGEFEKSMRNDVRLEVTGPGSNNDFVNYQFLISDGTLRFDENVDEPHYIARFSTFDYPVVTDETYKATVYVENKIVCYKEFKVLEQGNRSNNP